MSDAVVERARFGGTKQSKQRKLNSAADPIVSEVEDDVKPETQRVTAVTRRRARKNFRRQSHGSARHWKPTDAWYHTTIERVVMTSA